jgi:transcriptional regulator with XRE-family HTH domain
MRQVKVDNLPMRIGQVICALRKERNMTQEDVAFAAGTDAGYLSRIERKTRIPSLQLLENIATALNTTMSSLCAAAEGLENPASLPNEFQANFSKDFSDEAIQLRQTFHDLTSVNQRITVTLLQALRQTQNQKNHSGE